MKQLGSGKCSICGSPGTSKLTCPLNPDTKNPNPSKHPLAKSNMSSAKPKVSSKPKVTTVLPKDSKLLQLKGPGSMPKPSVKSSMLTKKIKPVLPKSTFMKSMSILDNRNRERNPVEHNRRMTALDTIDSLMGLPQDVGDKIFEYSRRKYSDNEIIKRLIMPVNYVNMGEDPDIKNETGQYVYFITTEHPSEANYTPYENMIWFNNYSSALDFMQGFTNYYNFYPTYEEEFSRLYIYFFDSFNYYLVGEEHLANGKYSININIDILKYISGNNFKGDVIYHDYEIEGVYTEKPTDGTDENTITEIKLN